MNDSGCCKKILLTTLNSKYVHTNLALKYLYVTSKDVCDRLTLKEYTINNDDEYIFNDLVQGDYDIICFSCYIWNVEKLRELAENLKKACPDVIIIMGGPEVSYDAPAFLRENPAVDFIVRGEGEYTLRCLLEKLQEGRHDFENIKGLSFRAGTAHFSGNGEVSASARAGIAQTDDADLLVFETVPFPYEFFPCEKDRVIYYESTRGCPYKCAYCISSLEKKMRALPLERVCHDLDRFIYSGVRQVKFIDRTFNWDRERCRQILSYIISRDTGLTNYHFELCGDLIDAELISLLSNARPGLFQFEIGIQSTNQKTLLAINRRNDLELTLENIRRLVSLGNSDVHVDLIAGLPFEDYQTFKKSFNDVYELGAGAFQLGFLKLLKGTEIRRQAEKYDYKFKSKAPYEVISNMFISAKELTRLKQMEYLLDVYYNRGGFANTLAYITRVVAASPFDFFEEFAIFYNLKGYAESSHKKEDMYRILYQYISWKLKDDERIIDEVRYLLEEDMDNTLNPEAVKRFKKRGFEL